MDVPKITTDCPECKPLLEQQQAFIDALMKQIENLTKRREKVELSHRHARIEEARQASAREIHS